jgi:HSP20 family molecular chaperone IbpA
MHAAITVKAAHLKGRLVRTDAGPVAYRVIKEFAMFFAPVLRTRAAAPSFRSFDRSFERFFNTLGFDVKQDEKSWTLSLDLPGIARDDLNISVEGAVVRIETKAEAKRQYKAAYELPEEIDAEATSASLENGVLTLALAKKQPVDKSRKIEVK